MKRLIPGLIVSLGIHVILATLLVSDTAGKLQLAGIDQRLQVELVATPQHTSLAGTAKKQTSQRNKTEREKITTRPQRDKPSKPVKSTQLNTPAPRAVGHDDQEGKTLTEIPAQPVIETKSTSSAITPPQYNAAHLHNTPPAYPALARRHHIEGKLTLKVRVNSEGLPTDVNIETSSGATILDHAAVEAVEEWRFIPAQQAGVNIEDWVIVPVEFRLRNP